MKAERVPVVPAGDAFVALPASASHELWLATRKPSVGGSEGPALVGLGYSTPMEVFRNKAEGWSGPAFEGNVFTEWGHRLEAAVIKKAVDMLGMVARPGGQIWRNPNYPHVHATPDAFFTKPRSWTALGLIEAKTAGDGEGWENDGAPLHYQAQCQLQMLLLGLPVTYLACLELGPARTFHLVEVPFDRAWAEEIAHVAKTFWVEHVIPGIPPMLDLAHPRTEELLKQLHPKVVRPSVELPEEAAEWLADYHQAKADVEKADARVAEIKNWILMHIGDAGAGFIGDKKVVSCPEVKTSRIDLTKLRESFPEAADACTVTGTHRRLTIKSPK